MARVSGSRGMQELNVIPVVTPITKYATLVDDLQKIRYHMERALYEAMKK